MTYKRLIAPGYAGMLAGPTRNIFQRFSEGNLPFGVALAEKVDDPETAVLYSLETNKFSGFTYAVSNVKGDYYRGGGGVYLTRLDKIWVWVDDPTITFGSDVFVRFKAKDGVGTGVLRSNNAESEGAISAVKISGYRFASNPWYEGSSAVKGVAIVERI